MPFHYEDDKDGKMDDDKGGLFVGEIHASDVDAGRYIKDVEEYVDEYDE